MNFQVKELEKWAKIFFDEVHISDGQGNLDAPIDWESNAELDIDPDERENEPIKQLVPMSTGEKVATALDSNPEGHNQYTGGSGQLASGSLPSKKSDPITRAHEKCTVKNAAIINKELRTSGFPANKVRIVMEDRNERVAGGMISGLNGMFLPNAGKITYFAAHMGGISADTVREIVHHEIGHSIYEKALKDPELNPITHAPSILLKLNREDGVTEYSKSYWKELASNRVCLHETFAEIHAMVMVHGAGWLAKNVKPEWRAHYQNVISKYGIKR
jgi:hypothetical protein